MEQQVSSATVYAAVFVWVLLSGSGSLLRQGISGVDAGCVELGRCCDGKNSTCRALGPRMNNARAKVCFCDSNCLRVRDCCTDYNLACSQELPSTTTPPPTPVPVDCMVSQWSDWSECDVRCGTGVKQRTRRVLQQPLNNGQPCPPALVEKTVCEGTGCKLPRASDTQEVLKETAKIVPAAFGGWRKNKKYDPFQDIRKNLFEHYEQQALSKDLRPSYCAQFEILDNRASCMKSPLVQWTKLLLRGATICVECQSLVMNDPQVGDRCRGHGVLNRETRWSAVAVPGCHGKWVMKTPHAHCRCDPDNEHSFVLV